MLVTRPYRKVISLVLLSHEPSSRFDSELHGRFLTKLRRRLHTSFVRVSDKVRSPTPVSTIVRIIVRSFLVDPNSLVFDQTPTSTAMSRWRHIGRTFVLTYVTSKCTLHTSQRKVGLVTPRKLGWVTRLAKVRALLHAGVKSVVTCWKAAPDPP